MSVSRTITPHIPYLRRFARALAGNQPSGDAYVGALLDVLSEDPGSFPQGLSPRVGLYKSFLKVWNSVSLNLKRDEGNAAEEAADRKIEMMTPLPRQAFLLNAVEDFTTEEVAEIIGLPVDEVLSLLDDAGREIAEHIATDILIIEDEPMIAFDLEGIVESLGHNVMAIARTQSDVLRICKTRRPGLVLADIQLADGSSGVDAVNEMLKMYEVPVIFITAYPQQLLTGMRPEPTFLITKPYRAETVKATISQSLFFEEKAHRMNRTSRTA